MSKYLKIIFLILFAISVAGNVILVKWEGVHIHHKYVNNNQQYQMQGQLLINMYTMDGDEIRWHAKYFYSVEDVMGFLITLHPSSSYFAKVSYNSDSKNGFYVFYPTFLKKSTKE